MAQAVSLAKQEARRMFGWVPPEERNLNPFLQSLKARGFKTTEELRDYVHKELMPPTPSQRLRQRNAQAVRPAQTARPVQKTRTARQEPEQKPKKTVKVVKPSLMDAKPVSKAAKPVQKKTVKQALPAPKQRTKAQISNEAKAMLNAQKAPKMRKPAQSQKAQKPIAMGLTQSMSMGMGRPR